MEPTRKDSIPLPKLPSTTAEFLDLHTIFDEILSDKEETTPIPRRWKSDQTLGLSMQAESFDNRPYSINSSNDNFKAPTPYVPVTETLVRKWIKDEL